MRYRLATSSAPSSASYPLHHKKGPYNGAAVTGVEKREIKIPIKIQKQAVV
jgi:hypothetical protein